MLVNSLAQAFIHSELFYLFHLLLHLHVIFITLFVCFLLLAHCTKNSSSSKSRLLLTGANIDWLEIHIAAISLISILQCLPDDQWIMAIINLFSLHVVSLMVKPLNDEPEYETEHAAHQEVLKMLVSYGLHVFTINNYIYLGKR